MNIVRKLVNLKQLIRRTVYHRLVLKDMLVDEDPNWNAKNVVKRLDESCKIVYLVQTPVSDQNSVLDFGCENFEKFWNGDSGSLIEDSVPRGTPCDSSGLDSGYLIDDSGCTIQRQLSAFEDSRVSSAKLVVDSWVWDHWCETSEGRSWLLGRPARILMQRIIIQSEMK